MTVVTPPDRFQALEVGVFAGVGHRRDTEQAQRRPGRKTPARGFPMPLFGRCDCRRRASSVYDNGFVDVTNHELSHVPITPA